MSILAFAVAKASEVFDAQLSILTSKDATELARFAVKFSILCCKLATELEMLEMAEGMVESEVGAVGAVGAEAVVGSE